MDYRNLGKSGLRVSPIVRGTVRCGDRTGAREGGRSVECARAEGSKDT